MNVFFTDVEPNYLEFQNTSFMFLMVSEFTQSSQDQTIAQIRLDFIPSFDREFIATKFQLAQFADLDFQIAKLTCLIFFTTLLITNLSNLYFILRAKM